MTSLCVLAAAEALRHGARRGNLEQVFTSAGEFVNLGDADRAAVRDFSQLRVERSGQSSSWVRPLHCESDSVSEKRIDTLRTAQAFSTLSYHELLACCSAISAPLAEALVSTENGRLLHLSFAKAAVEVSILLSACARWQHVNQCLSWWVPIHHADGDGFWRALGAGRGSHPPRAVTQAPPRRPSS